MSPALRLKEPKPLLALLVIFNFESPEALRVVEEVQPTCVPPVAKTPPAAVIAPLEATLVLNTPFNCKSIRLPAKPLAAFTPNPVPEVLQAAEVAPVVSIRKYGFVVVAEPVVAQVPLNSAALPVKDPVDADSAPFTVENNWPPVIFSATLSVIPPEAVNSPAMFVEVVPACVLAICAP